MKFQKICLNHLFAWSASNINSSCTLQNSCVFFPLQNASVAFFSKEFAYEHLKQRRQTLTISLQTANPTNLPCRGHAATSKRSVDNTVEVTGVLMSTPAGIAVAVRTTRQLLLSNMPPSRASGCRRALSRGGRTSVPHHRIAKWYQSCQENSSTHARTPVELLRHQHP